MDTASLASKLLPAIVLLPFVGAISIGLFGRRDSRKTVHGIAIGTVAGSFVISCILFALLFVQRASGEEAESFIIVSDLYEWFSVYWTTAAGDAQAVPVRIRLVMDALSGIMALFVTGIGLLIHIYSAGYMSDEPSYARFFAYLNLFMGSMLVLVLGSSLPVLFVGWEGVGLCSYLLIGFWWQNPAYAAAGRKAFVVNRIGDFGVIAGTLLLFGAVHSFEFSSINDAASTLAETSVSLGKLGSVSLATIACLCLFLGCTGKSAQIPLFIWLPDAMAGPTPVSALIHAATMVTAGVYLMCRLSPVFAVSPVALAVIAVVGTATAFVAASIALVQNQLKKVLAYSTVSQLGFMVAAVGVGAFGAGFFHVFTHAFFKACLFLGAGSVMHAVHAHGDADLRELGGLRKYMPITHATFLISCLAIAGIPPFAGFFSKDEILLAAAQASELFPFAPWLGHGVYLTLTATAALTAFYMFRLYFMTFSGTSRSANHDHDSEAHHSGAHSNAAHHHAAHAAEAAHAAHAPHESPASMTMPLVILAIGAVGAGWLGLPHAFHLPNFWSAWLEPVLAHAQAGHEEHGGLALQVMAMGTAAAVLGVVGSYVVYGKGAGRVGANLSHSMPGVYRFLLGKWRIDEFYTLIVVRPLEVFAEFCSVVDKIVVDGILTRVSTAIVRAVAFLLTRLQTGRTYTYATAMAGGIAMVLWWFIYPHACLEGTSVGNKVSYELAPGLGYSYQWDLDSDGTVEIPWGDKIFTVSNTYAPGSVAHSAKGAVLVFHPLLGAPSDAMRLTVKPGRSRVLDASWLGDNWAVDKDSPIPPAVRFDHGKLFIRPNDALMSRDLKSNSEVALELGSKVQIGEKLVQIAPLVSATAYVRNGFGNVRKTTKCVALESYSPSEQVDPHDGARKAPPPAQPHAVKEPHAAAEPPRSQGSFQRPVAELEHRVEKE